MKLESCLPNPKQKGVEISDIITNISMLIPPPPTNRNLIRAGKAKVNFIELVVFELVSLSNYIKHFSL